MNLTYKTIAEPTKAGAKWQQLFHTAWPTYKSWLKASKFASRISLGQRETALKRYMPKLWDTYVHLCSLLDTDDNELAKNFLTGYCPPAYVGACTQAVIRTDKIQLVRNYDYHPRLLEGTLFLSMWNDKKVIATSDCLIGAVDGMNDSGLCVSLTFGGRKQIGLGFGIPFILRYVLEFCSTTSEAVSVLKSIPSHMSYNVTIVDKKGNYKTVLLAPDKRPVVSSVTFATNHQKKVDWAENAAFNQTLKRSKFLKSFLKTKNLNAAELIKAFLHSPSYNSTYKEGFGTLYTAAYQPETLTVQILWPDKSIEKSFDSFAEEKILIRYKQENLPIRNSGINEQPETLDFNWQDAIVESLVSVFHKQTTETEKQKLKANLMPDKHIAWEAVIEYWNQPLQK